MDEKRQAWTGHWQVGTEAQNLDDKPWKNKELRDKEKVLRPMRIEELQNAARSYKSLTGW